MSSIRGSGYWSMFRAGFTVTLKSPQSRTEPSAFGTTNTGVAHSLQVTGVMMFSHSSRSSSVSTFVRRLYGTGLAFMKTGIAPFLSVSLAFRSAIFPIVSLAISGYLANRHSTRCCISVPILLQVIDLIELQLMGIFTNQFVLAVVVRCHSQLVTVISYSPPPSSLQLKSDP